jgi:hypothetical protein
MKASLAAALSVVIALAVAFGALQRIAPNWLGEPLHGVKARLTAPAAVKEKTADIGSAELARELLQQLKSPFDRYTIEALPLGQRSARWDSDTEETATLFDLSEQLPLEGDTYNPDRTLVVSGGFLQFLSSLESSPPGRHATETARTARRNALERLQDLDASRKQIENSSISSSSTPLKDVAANTTEAIKAVRAYARALGGSPKAIDIGSTIFAYFNPAEQMFVTRGGLPERAPKVSTQPQLAQFHKNSSAVAIPSKPLGVTVRCNSQPDRQDVFDTHFGVEAAQVLWFARGKWFNHDLLQRYRTGYWSTEAPPSPEAYFYGPRGRLRLIPAGLLVVRAPFLLVDTPATLTEDLRNGTCKLVVGVADSTSSWTIDAGTTSSLVNGKVVAAQGVKYRMTDSDTPWVLAVLSERP